MLSITMPERRRTDYGQRVRSFLSNFPASTADASPLTQTGNENTQIAYVARYEQNVVIFPSVPNGMLVIGQALPSITTVSISLCWVAKIMKAHFSLFLKIVP